MIPVKHARFRISRVPQRVGALLLLVLVAVPADRGADPASPASQPAAAVAKPWWLVHESPRSRVVEARDGDARDGATLAQFVVDELLASSIQILTDEATADRAWRAILGSAERIVILFDGNAARLQDTADTLGRVIVQQLVSAGYEVTGITLINAPDGLALSLGTPKPERGWGQPIPVGGHLEQMPSYLDDADAVINVPTLAAQPIGGASGCVQNAALSFVRHPARYYRESGLGGGGAGFVE